MGVVTPRFLASRVPSRYFCDPSHATLLFLRPVARHTVISATSRTPHCYFCDPSHATLLLLRPVAALARARDVHFLAVFGDRPTSHVEAERFQPPHQFDIAVWFRFVFAVDQFLKLDPNLVPRDIFTVFGLSLIHISEPTRPRLISYAVFCLKKKK